MTAITERQIDRIALYGGPDASSTSRLRMQCRTHQRELHEIIAKDVNKLIQSPFFQTQFASFLPPAGSKGHYLNIRITGNALEVQKLQYDESAGTWNPVDSAAVVQLSGEAATSEGLQISQEMISHADEVYQKCVKAHARGHGSLDSRHVSRIDLDDDLDAPLRTRRGRSEELDSDEIDGLYRDLDKLTRRLERLTRRGDSAHSPEWHRLQERIARIEARIRALEDLDMDDDELPVGRPGRRDIDIDARLDRLEEILDGLSKAREPISESAALQRAREESEDLRRKFTDAERARLDAQSQVSDLLRAKAETTSSLIPNETLQTCLELADQLEAASSETTPPAPFLEQFQRLDPRVKDSVFFHTYLLHSPERYEDWDLGKYYFFNEHQHDRDFITTNGARAIAVRNFVLEHLAEKFHTASPSERTAILDIFHRLPEMERNNIYRHLWHIHKPHSSLERSRYGEFAFLSQEGLSATDVQRGRAIANHLQEKLVEHHKMQVDMAIEKCVEDLVAAEEKVQALRIENAQLQSELAAARLALATTHRT
jgi:hypothetical protein